GLLSSSCSYWGWWSRRLLLLGGHVDHDVHHPAAVAEFIVIPGNELDKVVIEGNASPSVEGGRVGVTVEVTGDNLVLSVAQDALEGASDACFTTFLMSSYLAAFSRRQVRSTTDTLGVGTQKAMPVSFPFSSGMTLPTALAAPVEAGMTLPTALAAPVEAGMMFWAAPHRQATASQRGRPLSSGWQ
uniref:Uncharacterized protein n=1 Tax=Canis lupus familiaris TaxID=9615 RepID=A0A8C0Z344_CANLF